jgi:hypothetical protein
MAIDDANPHDTCDVEILFEHSKYVKCWAHYAIIAVRCPRLAEEIDTLRISQAGAAPAASDPSRGAQLIKDIDSGNIPVFAQRSRISVMMKETYSVMKALLQFIYLGAPSNLSQLENPFETDNGFRFHTGGDLETVSRRFQPQGSSRRRRVLQTNGFGAVYRSSN